MVLLLLFASAFQKWRAGVKRTPDRLVRSLTRKTRIFHKYNRVTNLFSPIECNRTRPKLLF